MLQVKIKDDTGNTIGQNIRRIRKSRNIGQTALVRDLQLLDIDMTREASPSVLVGASKINPPGEWSAALLLLAVIIFRHCQTYNDC